MVRLDTPSFNEFELNCSVNVPKESGITVSFSWEEDSVSLPGNTSKSYTTVKDSPTYGITQSNILYVKLIHLEMATSHFYTYKCSVAFHESNNTAHQFSKVTVKGDYMFI